MSDNKILLTLAALIGTYIAISKFTNDSIQENYTDQMTTKPSGNLGETSLERTYNIASTKNNNIFVGTANREKMIQSRSISSFGSSRVPTNVDHSNLATEVHDLEDEVRDLKDEVHHLEDDVHHSEDVFVASRLIHANKRSRQQAQGCPFRGDIPCPPCPIVSKPSASHHDLRQGAFGVTTDSETKDTYAALATASGHGTAHGVDLVQQTVAFH